MPHPENDAVVRWLLSEIMSLLGDRKVSELPPDERAKFDVLDRHIKKQLGES